MKCSIRNFSIFALIVATQLCTLAGCAMPVRFMTQREMNFRDMKTIPKPTFQNDQFVAGASPSSCELTEADSHSTAEDVSKTVDLRKWKATAALGVLFAAAALCISGCAKQEPENEKVIDINAPGVDIEVRESDDGAAVDIETPEE